MTVLSCGRLRLQYGTNFVGEVERLSGSGEGAVVADAGPVGDTKDVLGLAVRSAPLRSGAGGAAVGSRGTKGSDGGGGRCDALIGTGSGRRPGEEVDGVDGEIGWPGRRGGGDTEAGPGSGVGSGERTSVLDVDTDDAGACDAVAAAVGGGGFGIPKLAPGVGSGLREGGETP